MFGFIVISAFGATNSNVVNYKYSAKRVVFDKKTGVTILKGDAKITKTDAESGAQSDYINADQITLYTKHNEETGKDELTKMESMGNVKMKQGDMTVTCARAVMVYEPEEVIDMEGSKDALAVADDGKNRIEAPLIRYFRKDDRLEAEAAEGNVTGQITIEERKTEK